MAQWARKVKKITHWAHVGAWPPYLRLIRDYWFVGPHSESQKNTRETRDFYFLTPQCLPIEPFGELYVWVSSLVIFYSEPLRVPILRHFAFHPKLQKLPFRKNRTSDDGGWVALYIVWGTNSDSIQTVSEGMNENKGRILNWLLSRCRLCTQ